MSNDRQKLLRAAHRILDAYADAEDAVQDTYVRAFSTFADWRAPEPAWMYTVLRNIAIDRHRHRRMASLHAAAALPAEGPPSDPLETQAECEAALRHLLGRVGPAEAAALLLRDVFEFDYREIAELLDKSEPAMRQILHRARLRVRDADTDRGGEEPYVALCLRAIEAREPAILMELLRGITARAPNCTAATAGARAARSECLLVHVNGRYAMALVLDGVVLCIVPVGIESPQPLQTG